MPTATVICAFDDSLLAERASEMAAWLAATLNARLEVIHVFDAGAQPALPREGNLRDPVMHMEVRARLNERTRTRMQAIMEGVADRLPTDDVDCRVLEGRVVPTLHKEAVERRAVLLVSGTAARAGMEHVLRGSVSGRLTAHAPCPVVSVPPEAAIAEPGPVLAGDDGSDHARRAVSHAAALAAGLGRELVCIHASENEPAQELSAAAHEHRACLIVTGARGRGPIRAELFGSVSCALVQTAARPVMLVPASAGEAPAPRG